MGCTAFRIGSGEEPWQTLELDVDAWMDQTFVVGDALQFDDLYVCSCPDYLHAKIRSPETFDSDGGSNRRRTTTVGYRLEHI